MAPLGLSSRRTTCTSLRRSPSTSPRRSPARAISSTISRSRAERHAPSTATMSASAARSTGRSGSCNRCRARIRRAPRTAAAPGPASTTPAPAAAPAPETDGPACASHVMNKPSCSTPAGQGRPDLAHHRRNNAIEPAYAFVVDSAPSRPNRTCRRNESATATSSSRTVQYLAPDGNLTGKARIPDPPDLALSCVNNYQPRAPHPRRRAAEPRHMCHLGDVMQQAGGPRRTRHDGVGFPGELAEVGSGARVQPPAADLLAHLLQRLGADRGLERAEDAAVPGPGRPRAEGVPQEREGGAGEVPAPVGVLAVHDLGLVGVQAQPDFGHPLIESGPDLAGLGFRFAVYDGVVGIPFEISLREV